MYKRQKKFRPAKLYFKGHIVLTDPYYVMDWGKLDKVFPPEESDYETIEEYEMAVHQYRTIYDDWYKCREGKVLQNLGYYLSTTERGFRKGSIHEFFSWSGEKIGEIDLPSGRLGIMYYDEIIQNNPKYKLEHCIDLPECSLNLKFNEAFIYDEKKKKDVKSKVLINRGMNMFFSREEIIKETYKQEILK